MPFIKTDDSMFQEDAVVSVQHNYDSQSEIHYVTLSLVNGHILQFSGNTAEQIWEIFTDKLGHLSIIVSESPTPEEKPE